MLVRGSFYLTTRSISFHNIQKLFWKKCKTKLCMRRNRPNSFFQKPQTKMSVKRDSFGSVCGKKLLKSKPLLKHINSKEASFQLCMFPSESVSIPFTNHVYCIQKLIMQRIKVQLSRLDKRKAHIYSTISTDPSSSWPLT